MELGNLVFGNSRGLFSVPREWDVVLARLFDAFEPPMSCHGRDFENGTFWIFPYHWNGCSCGWDVVDNNHQTLSELEHESYCCQRDWARIAGKYPFDRFELRLAEVKRVFERYGWDTQSENWWYGYMQRCTCDYDKRCHAILGQYAEEFGCLGHESDCLLMKDNFHHKPTGFGLQWYKYALRDAYMNKDISRKEFEGIVEDCIRSLRVYCNWR